MCVIIVMISLFEAGDDDNDGDNDDDDDEDWIWRGGGSRIGGEGELQQLPMDWLSRELIEQVYKIKLMMARPKCYLWYTNLWLSARLW